MSRTTLCVGTAALLALGSLTVMIARWRVLGDDVHAPGGPGTWRVTLLVQGRSTGDTRLSCATPLTTERQHVLREQGRSEELAAQAAADHQPGERHRDWVWVPKPGTKAGTFRVRYECSCTLQGGRPRTDHPPQPGECLQAEPSADRDHPEIAGLARRLCVGQTTPADKLVALYQYVEQEIANEPSVTRHARGAVECLRLESGDSGAKARLLVALCRNQGIPARIVTGLMLPKGDEQGVHHWVEAWIEQAPDDDGAHKGEWLPMCPFYHRYGRVPLYLVLAYGDRPVVHGKNVRIGDFGFLVERLPAGGEAAAPPTRGQRFFTACSLSSLSRTDRQLADFLLLVPVGALIVCVFRNLIGLNSFGTFAPALLGLAFREWHSLPGMLVFVCILLVGWLLRRGIDRYHLLQVPRTAFMLSLVICVLLGLIALSSHWQLPTTRYISLFPMVILTGMIERFWTLEEEDGTSASFRTLLTTMGIAACISLVLSWHGMTRRLFDYPEAIGLVMACQLLLGRYTGYRLLELYRFRDFLHRPPAQVGGETPCILSLRQSLGETRF